MYWGKTAVEMAILPKESFTKGTMLGFGIAPREGVKKTKPGFF
jgi:hypothetical protein